MTVTRLEHHSFDWRRGTGGADDVRRIAEAAAAADGRSALNEAAVLSLRNHGLDTGLLLVEGADGHPDGFAYLHGLHGGGRPELDLVVSPEARGRGVGTALARATLAAVDGIPITAWSHGNHPAAAALAARVGLEAVRELWLMRRLSAEPVPVRPVPEGYAIRAFRAGQDEAGFLAVNAAAFAGHPEQGGLDRRGLLERMAEDWFDPAGFLVGERDGRIVGFHWTKVHPAAGGVPAYGEVYVIGVDPGSQGSGIGRAMLAAGLEHLRSRGLAEVVLYVEAANVGAVRLYESYGFTHAAVDTDVMYATS
jgi:mycothiol synthase